MDSEELKQKFIESLRTLNTAVELANKVGPSIVDKLSSEQIRLWRNSCENFVNDIGAWAGTWIALHVKYRKPIHIDYLSELDAPAEAPARKTIDIPTQPIAVSAWSLGWLKLLIDDYHDEHDWQGDEDPNATHEMLDAVRDIYHLLSDRFPACDSHETENASVIVDGRLMCDDCYAQFKSEATPSGDAGDVPF